VADVFEQHRGTITH